MFCGISSSDLSRNMDIKYRGELAWICDATRFHSKLGQCILDRSLCIDVSWHHSRSYFTNNTQISWNHKYLGKITNLVTLWVRESAICSQHGTASIAREMNTAWLLTVLDLCLASNVRPQWVKTILYRIVMICVAAFVSVSGIPVCRCILSVLVILPERIAIQIVAFICRVLH